MALDRRRAASEKLPSSSTGTVISREQLRRQLSARTQSSGDGVKQSEPRRHGTQISGDGVIETLPRPQVRFEADASSEDGTAGFQRRQRPSAQGSMARQTTVQLRKGSSLVKAVSDREDEVLKTEVSLVQDDDRKLTGVVELSTLHQRRAPHVKVRVICLIDVSGSMLLKGDKRNLRSKISIMKNMAVDIVDALEDEEDFFGVMTFGDKARLVCPLTRVTSATRAQVKTMVSALDKGGGFSSHTDLSSALQQAVDMLAAGQNQDGLLYRNCIIVLSDGEINAGETDPTQLVHATREKIRECALPSDILADLWVNISCVTTGSNFSHSLYLLSKLCGSDAYFFVDGSHLHPEADMLIPLMLRKTACAQMVSVTIRGSEGVVLDQARCSQEYSVRRRRGRDVGRQTMAYFIHDLPTGIKKTFQVSLDASGFTTTTSTTTSSSSSSSSSSSFSFYSSSAFSSSNSDEHVLSVDVQYVDSIGVLHNVSKRVRRQDVVSLQSGKPRALEIIAKTAVSSLRQILQKTCRNVANLMENADDATAAAAAADDDDDDGDDNDDGDGNADRFIASVNAAIRAGTTEAQALAAQTLSKLEAGSPQRYEFETLADAIAANLEKLRSLVETNASNRSKCWQLAKAMSSAVVRELPTVTNVLARPQVVCPLPEVRGSDSRRVQALSLYIFGADDEPERATQLHNAAKDVAKSLADVLKALESD